jgi:hypothetical protein
MTRPVGGVMMALGQGWGSVCLVGILAQTSPISAVQQVDGSSQNVRVSNTAWPDLRSQLYLGDWISALVSLPSSGFMFQDERQI